MFDEGHVAIVPVDTTISPIVYEINTREEGKLWNGIPIIKVEIYNDQIGRKERIASKKYGCYC